MRPRVAAAAQLRLPPRVRSTPQRRAVADAIAATEGAFTAADIYERARSVEPRLGLATVYRTIDLLRRAGSVRPLSGQGRPAYVRCHPGHHHHLVCSECGAVIEIRECDLRSLERRLTRSYDFRIEEHAITFRGRCARCS